LSLKTFYVAKKVLLGVRCFRRVGTGDFWREHEQWQTPDADADTKDDEAEPPGANPTWISLVDARI